MRRSPLLFLFLTVMVDVWGYSMMIPLLPFFVVRSGGNAAIAGMLGSLYALLQLFSGPVLGSLSDRVGRKPVLLICLGGTAVAYGLFGIAQSLGVLLLAVLLDGLTGNNLTTAYAYVADVTDEGNRGRSLGMLGAAFGIGMMIGPAVGGWLSDFGLSVPAFVAALMALLNVLYGWMLLPESLDPLRRATRPMSWNALSQVRDLLGMQQLRPLLVAIFLINLGFSGLQMNFPLFSHRRFGWSARENGFFFAYVGVLAVFVQGVLYGRIRRVMPESHLALIGLGLMAMGLSGIAITPAAWILYLSVGIAALGSGVSIPSLTALLSLRAPASSQGQLMGGQQSVIGVANLFGPALAGVSFQFLAISAPYWFSSLLAILAMVLLWRGEKNNKPLSAERK